MQPGSWVVDHYFVSPVQVIAGAVCGQRGRENPLTAVEINELTLGDIIISFDVREIVVVDPVVTLRPPGRLSADIDIDTNLDLGMHLAHYQAKGTDVKQFHINKTGNSAHGP